MHTRELIVEKSYQVLLPGTLLTTKGVFIRSWYGSAKTILFHSRCENLLSYCDLSKHMNGPVVTFSSSTNWLLCSDKSFTELAVLCSTESMQGLKRQNPWWARYIGYLRLSDVSPTAKSCPLIQLRGSSTLYSLRSYHTTAAYYLPVMCRNIISHGFSRNWSNQRTVWSR